MACVEHAKGKQLPIYCGAPFRPSAVAGEGREGGHIDVQSWLPAGAVVRVRACTLCVCVCIYN